MILDSSVFPLGGGSANIAGFEWSEKTADFTAEANKAYYCDTALNDILMTLPINPSPGDEVAFLIIGINSINFITSDNVKSNPLPVDYGKTIAENYLMVILFYVDNTVGWNWDTRYNSFISDTYLGNGTLLTYTSTTQLDGLINWLGTNKGTSSFINPYPALVGIEGKRDDSTNPPPPVINPGNLLNKNTLNGTSINLVQNLPRAGILITLPAGTLLKPSKFVIFHKDTGSDITTAFIEGRKQDGSFVSLGSYFFNNVDNNNWASMNYNGEFFFDAFYIKSSFMYYQLVCVFEVWGLFLG